MPIFYQARNGAVYMRYGEYSTCLTLEQVIELKIQLHMLENFNPKMFRAFYKQQIIEQYSG